MWTSTSWSQRWHEYPGRERCRNPVSASPQMANPVRQIGDAVGRQGMKDSEIIPLLHGLASPTFFTRDDDFYDHRLCHASYCLVHCAVGKNEVAVFVRRFRVLDIGQVRSGRLNGDVSTAHGTECRKTSSLATIALGHGPCSLCPLCTVCDIYRQGVLGRGAKAPRSHFHPHPAGSLCCDVCRSRARRETLRCRRWPSVTFCA